MQTSVKRPYGPGSKGFSLIEVLIGMAITGIVMGAIYSIFISSNRSYRTQDSVADAQQRVRVGMDFIAYDLRMAGLDPLGIGAGIEVADASGLSWTLRMTADLDFDGQIDNDSSLDPLDLNKERITYNYDAGSRTLRRRFYEGTGSVTGWQPVIEGVSDLTIRYFDRDGVTEYVAPVSADNLLNIRFVDITMNCQGTDAQGQPINRRLTSRVICRNLYLF